MIGSGYTLAEIYNTTFRSNAVENIYEAVSAGHTARVVNCYISGSPVGVRTSGGDTNNTYLF